MLLPPGKTEPWSDPEDHRAKDHRAAASLTYSWPHC